MVEENVVEVVGHMFHGYVHERKVMVLLHFAVESGKPNEMHLVVDLHVVIDYFVVWIIFTKGNGFYVEESHSYERDEVKKDVDWKLKNSQMGNVNFK